MKIVAIIFLLISILSLCSFIYIINKFKDKKETTISWLNIIASFTSIISLCLAISFYCFDKAKIENEEKLQTKKIILLIKEEVQDNIEILSKNTQALQLEVEVIPENKSVVTPIIILKNNYYDLFKFNLPFRILKNDIIYLNISQAYNEIHAINENIRSRENYRIHNQAMSNLGSRLKIYNEKLLNAFKELRIKLEKIEKELST